MHTQTTILIVDATVASMEITRQLLESNGYKTCGAENGRAALGLVSKELPELVLIDSHLPDMNGFEICRQIKALPELASVFVVIMLGEQFGGENQPVESEPGVDGYIVRPISERALLARIQAMLYERSAMAAVRHKEQLLGQRLDELAALNALGQQINLTLPLELILPRAVDEVIAAIQPDQVFIFLLKDGKLLLEAGRDVRGVDFFRQFPEHHTGECLCGLAMRDGRSLYSRDILNDRRCTRSAREECKRAGLRSFAALPLQAGQETFGALGLASLTERDFEQQAVFLQILAAQVSLVIQNARLYESVQNKLDEQKRLDEVLQDKNKVLAALQDTTRELISERDLQVLLENIVKRAGQLVGTEAGFLYLVEVGAAQLNPMIALGALTAGLQIGPRMGEGIAGLVWQTGRPQVIDDYDAWTGRIVSFPYGKICALASVPLLSGDNVVGVLGLAYERPSTRVFGPEALELLVQFARLASIALENARLFSALQQELVERGRAEQALRSSEERFRLAFNTSPDSININRLVDGLYVDINEGFTRITGYTRADAIGKTSLEINVWHDPADRARLVKGLREQGEVKNLEAQFRKKDGSLLTGLMSARIIMLGDVEHILTITRDIEEKKLIENALRASEKKFRSVVESSPTAMHFYHLEGSERLILIDANPAADRILGVQHQALIGKTIEAVFPNLVESEYPDMYRKVARGELGPQAFELQYSDNRLAGFYNIHVYQTAPGFILVDFIDISERKHTEQALREREFWLSESQRVGRIGSYSMDLSRDLWACSSVLDEIFGIEPFFEKTTSSWANLVHPDEREAMLDYFTHFVIGEKQPFDKEYRIVRANSAEERWVWGRGELLFDSHGAPIQMIGTIQDVTERKQAEEQIKKLNTQLEQRVAERTAQLQMTNKELEAFAYSVSHDLRAPLRGIDGWSLALQEDYGALLDAQGHKYLERVRSETQRMGQLIDDLLQLSRITRAEIQFLPIDLTALANEIAARLLEEQTGHRLEFSIQPGLTAQGDSHLLEIALTNLFSNACKFSSTRPVSQVVFGQTLQNGKLAYFVRDNGVGFDMIYAKNLFGAFQRMHKQSEFPGTGIGLATVQRIIHRHGGMIWADSRPDMGAVFYFTLETAA